MLLAAVVVATVASIAAAQSVPADDSIQNAQSSTDTSVDSAVTTLVTAPVNAPASASLTPASSNTDNTKKETAATAADAQVETKAQSATGPKTVTTNQSATADKTAQEASKALTPDTATNTVVDNDKFDHSESVSSDRQPSEAKQKDNFGIMSAAASAGVIAGGFIQADYTQRQSSADQLNQSTNEPLNENRFVVRRARLMLGIERPYSQCIVELDGNTIKGVTTRLVRAEATVRLPAKIQTMPLVALTAGLFKIPFGYEIAQSDKERFFAERSTIVRALFPGESDVGARLSGSYAFLRWAVAVQNGEPIGESVFPGRDPNSAKDFVGRIGAESKSGDYSIIAGVSLLQGKGFHKGSSGTKDTFTWRDYNENGVIDTGELINIPGQSPQASLSFKRKAFGADTRFTLPVPMLGKATLSAEAFISTNLDRGLIISDPISASRDLRQLGFSVALVQELPYGLSLGARYDEYNPDRDAQDIRSDKVVPKNATYSTLAIAANLRIDRYRLLVEYDINKNNKGRNTQGRPASIADNLFMARAEVTF
ncbi:MAG: hypothetical protein JW841_18405 [Deltaproteobacteria bacterium]|nr:hypothetical protein [Deltaproteobacteria bacterium]